MRRTCRRPFQTSLLSVASLAALTMGLTSCFTTTADFRNDAETFIEENDELRDVLFPGSDTAFETATCVEPQRIRTRGRRSRARRSTPRAPPGSSRS
jgi:hypothetical protein